MFTNSKNKDEEDSEPVKEPVYYFQCKDCSEKFEGDKKTNSCPKCESKSIEKDWENSEKILSFKDVFSLFNRSKKKDTKQEDEDKKMATKSGLKEHFHKTLSQLGTVREMVVREKEQEVNGEKSTKKTTLKDLYTPIIRKMGLVNKDNPNDPATDKAINNLKEVDTKEEKKEYDFDQLPICSICSEE